MALIADREAIQAVFGIEPVNPSNSLPPYKFMQEFEVTKEMIEIEAPTSYNFSKKENAHSCKILVFIKNPHKPEADPVKVKFDKKALDAFEGDSKTFRLFARNYFIYVTPKEDYVLQQPVFKKGDTLRKGEERIVTDAEGKRYLERRDDKGQFQKVIYRSGYDCVFALKNKTFLNQNEVETAVKMIEAEADDDDETVDVSEEVAAKKSTELPF